MRKNKVSRVNHPLAPSKGGQYSADDVAWSSFFRKSLSPFGRGWGVVSFFIFSKFNFILLILLLTFGSCVIDKKEDPAVRQKRLEEAVAEKIAYRRFEHMKNCQQTAIGIAEKRVDSILLAEAKLMTIDTISKPDKPTKPLPPEVAIPKDSSDVKPLFEEIPDTIK